MRILVADDHSVVRTGIVTVVSKLSNMQVVGEAGNGREALRLVRELLPDMVLLDITMPELNGLEAAERIHELHPKAKIIVLSMHTNEAYVVRALRAGASGYLVKESATVELEMALKCVALGQIYLSPAISRQVVDNLLHGRPSGLELLTLRQREILQLIAEGKSTREMATTLHLSVKTVEAHRAKLMERLDIHDTAGLIHYAIRKGLVGQDG
ncbi:MAG TPA: response regulator transcription factor [Gammaproteobacteria bacterium]|nr:response regulator transcription factor [Gammaproteobacteria bacterium]